MKIVPCLIAIALLPASVAFAQTVDYNRIILPERITATTFEEKLIQLAWRNHPSNRIVEENVKIAQKEKALASWSWLDNIYAVGNLNEFTVEGTSVDRQIFYPRYNFGVRFSLGTFVKTPLDNRVADSRLISAEFSVNEQKLDLRAQVLVETEQLKESFQIMNLRKKLKEEYYQAYRMMESKFQLNEVTLERLQNSQENYILQFQNMIVAESKFNQEKISLEALIGLKLEEVDGYPEFIRQLEGQLNR